MNNKVFFGILAVLVIGIGAVLTLSGDDETANTDATDEDIAAAIAIDEQNYRVKGEADAPVELVEFGDFGCGFCAQAVPQVEQVLNKYEGDIQFEFIPFAIPSSQNSVIAHRAAEAAGKQDKFFEMYELLYTNQQAWAQSTEAKELIDSYAKQIELDMDQYQSDFSDGDTLDTINDIKSTASDIGVTGTPTFFVNGERVETQGQIFQTLDQAISEALADSDSSDSSDTQAD